MLLRSWLPCRSAWSPSLTAPSALRDRMLRACLTEFRTQSLALYLLNMYFELDVAFSFSFSHSCGQRQELSQKALPSHISLPQRNLLYPTEHAQLADGIFYHIRRRNKVLTTIVLHQARKRGQPERSTHKTLFRGVKMSQLVPKVEFLEVFYFWCSNNFKFQIFRCSDSRLSTLQHGCPEAAFLPV